MNHRALATILCLVSVGCGLDATDPTPPAASADAAADGASVAEPLVVAPVVAAPPMVEPPVNEGVEEVLAAPPRIEATPARLDTDDFMRVYEVLPAMSADGRLIMTPRYETASDTIYVDIVRASTRRHVRSIALPMSGEDEEAFEAAVASIDRILEQRGFVTLGALEEVLPSNPDAETWDGVIRQWTLDDLSLHYDPSTGGLAVYRDYALVHQSLVPAQVPDGPGVGLMDPDYAELAMIPSADDVRISADGRTVAIRLSACDCSCDIEPFWKLIAL